MISSNGGIYVKKKIAILPGDGIGREIASGAASALEAVGKRFGHEFELEYANIGGAAIDSDGTPLPEETLTLSKKADAVLLGAVGGPKWDQNPGHLRPEAGLLGIRKALGLFANIRPATMHPVLVEASSLKPEVVSGVDLSISARARLPSALTSSSDAASTHRERPPARC